ETYLIAKWNVYVTRPEALPPPDAGTIERAWLLVRTRAFAYHVLVSLRCGCGFLVALAAVPALLAALRRDAPPFVRLAAALAFFARGTPNDLGDVLPQLRLAAELSPYRAEPAGAFEQEDAFFIPFRGFAGVVRPGPLVRIYAAGPPA